MCVIYLHYVSILDTGHRTLNKETDKTGPTVSGLVSD